MHGIDEGELEIGPYGYYASSLLYCYAQSEWFKLQREMGRLFGGNLKNYPNMNAMRCGNARKQFLRKAAEFPV
jgi:hypothetical protein